MMNGQNGGARCLDVESSLQERLSRLGESPSPATEERVAEGLRGIEALTRIAERRDRELMLRLDALRSRYRAVAQDLLWADACCRRYGPGMDHDWSQRRQRLSAELEHTTHDAWRLCQSLPGDVLATTAAVFARHPRD